MCLHVCMLPNKHLYIFITIVAIIVKNKDIFMV